MLHAKYRDIGRVGTLEIVVYREREREREREGEREYALMDALPT